MENPPDVLDIKDINKLIKQGRATHFRHFEDLPNIPQEDLLELINGEGHVLVDTHLYTQSGNFSYNLWVINWLKTDEGQKYKPLLEKICSNK
ncbi:unnamed protein product [marine sediment metagenome]|uniref:Uncharacterized protein n=1 Tax=marine sediment metagenome TaxID=412755 RepID=X1THM6_9ZZZZ